MTTNTQILLDKRTTKLQERLNRKTAKKTTKTQTIYDKGTIKISKKTAKTFVTATKK